MYDAGRFSFPLKRNRSSRLLKNPVLRVIFLMVSTMTRGVTGGGRRPLCGIWNGFASSSTGQTDSSRCRQNFRDANEIVGGRGQHEEPFHQAASTMAGLAQAAD